MLQRQIEFSREVITPPPLLPLRTGWLGVTPKKKKKKTTKNKQQQQQQQQNPNTSHLSGIGWHLFIDFFFLKRLRGVIRQITLGQLQFICQISQKSSKNRTEIVIQVNCHNRAEDSSGWGVDKEGHTEQSCASANICCARPRQNPRQSTVV